tara:strand:- start:2485 stop:3861 length:1377 start_codon:yes stop_codon:yes gene_type:complete
MYAIVDIETTGGSATNSRITEIAIVIHDGKKTINRFQSLVNACRDIPYKITQLTGITNDMIATAPLFKDLAEEIEVLTKDCIFVAHNVNFDYSFVKEEFRRAGIAFRRKKLCTVRLSRKLLPYKSTYSLGKLCESEGIKIKDRHRAMGDATATAILFEKLLLIDTGGFIEKSLNPQSYEALLPPNLDKAAFTALPTTQGLYYFRDQRKKIVYIGQAKNIKKRVHSHFSGNSNTKSKHYFVKTVHYVDFKCVSSDLLLSLLEAIEIKKHWPVYNCSLKRIRLNHGIFQYEDRNGFQRLSFGKCGKFDQPIKAFKSLETLKQFLNTLVIDFELCPRLCGLQPLGSGKCNYVEEIACKGACCGNETPETYNERFQEGLNTLLRVESNYLLVEKDTEKQQQAVVLVEKGRVKGYATSLALESNLSDLTDLKSKIESVYDDQDLLQIVGNFRIKANSDNVIYF